MAGKLAKMWSDVLEARGRGLGERDSRPGPPIVKAADR